MDQKLSNSVDVRNVEADTTRCYKSSVAKLLHACGDAADVCTFSVTALCREPSEVTPEVGGVNPLMRLEAQPEKTTKKVEQSREFSAG